MLATKMVRSGTLLSLFALSLAACSEVSTAPPGLSPDAGPLLSSGTDGRGQESGTRTFVVYPGLPIGQRFGDHVLFIPANAVCDPATSGYGAAYWDAPCAPIQRPIEITATWTTRNDRPVISFSPDLRFAPSHDESKWVSLSLKDTKGIDYSKYYTILWYNRDLGQWVDESVSDPSLRARPNQSGNLVTRRLKHFSDWTLWVGFGAYNVTSGMGGPEEVSLGLWGTW